ncbi:MAG: glycosyltransferase family 39 protein, partial [Anaerolineales bacterium]|nr:glycosyltransferase family 39 protein [Anaerolineales bacterium]
TQYKHLFAPFISSFILLLSSFVFISLTRIGLTPDPAYWGEPGVPIMGWQLMLALILGIVTFCISHYALRTTRYALLTPLFIYIFAIILWLSVPVDVLKNSFYVSIDPPAFQPFPYSDAGYYDWMAHSLLIGHPFQGDIPTRPLYIVFLTFLHALFGENYKLIIAGQTALLALIPVVFYFLGKRIHSHTAGVIIAIIAIFREFTSLLISSDTRVSNTKTLLVDLPTLLLVSLACLFALRWFEKKDIKSAFIAGGTFGVLLLLRTQSMLILPVIILFVILTSRITHLRPERSHRDALRDLFSFILGLVFTITPWLTHNYLQTGKFTFDAPFQYKVIASQYAYSGNLDLQNYDFAGKGLGQVLIEFAVKDPKFVFGFISNHFLAAQVDGLLALPLIKSYNGLFAPINLYWTSWNGNLEWYNVLLLIFYLAVISVGLAAAWKRLRWAGLLPLAFNFAYVLATAIGRFSGWRYDLPADWVPYFYFGIGFAEIITLIALLFGAQENIRADGSSPRQAQGNAFAHRVEDTQSKRTLPGMIILAFVFALIGGLPWLAKGIASPRYADQSPSTLSAQITSIPGAPASSEIETFLSQQDTTLQMGRLLYPRFYIRNEGAVSKNPWPAYETRSYPRLGFLLLNQSLAHAVFPTKANVVDSPQASDVIMLACKRPDYLEVRLLAFPALNTTYLSAPLSEPCH